MQSEADGKDLNKTYAVESQRLVLIKEQLTECDLERLHEIGAIQNVGYLLGIKSESGSLRVATISDNFSVEIWGSIFSDLSKVLDRPLYEIFPKEFALTIYNIIRRFEGAKLSASMTCDA